MTVILVMKMQDVRIQLDRSHAHVMTDTKETGIHAPVSRWTLQLI